MDVAPNVRPELSRQAWFAAVDEQTENDLAASGWRYLSFDSIRRQTEPRHHPVHFLDDFGGVCASKSRVRRRKTKIIGIARIKQIETLRDCRHLLVKGNHCQGRQHWTGRGTLWQMSD